MKILRGLLGLAELSIFVWGIITFWNTPWSIAALVYVCLCVLVAMFEVGKETGSKDNKGWEINNE